VKDAAQAIYGDAIFSRPHSTFSVSIMDPLMTPANRPLLDPILRDYRVDLLWEGRLMPEAIELQSRNAAGSFKRPWVHRSCLDSACRDFGQLIPQKFDSGARNDTQTPCVCGQSGICAFPNRKK
jgi:hypothetical protein